MFFLLCSFASSAHLGPVVSRVCLRPHLRAPTGHARISWFAACGSARLHRHHRCDHHCTHCHHHCHHHCLHHRGRLACLAPLSSCPLPLPLRAPPAAFLVLPKGCFDRSCSSRACSRVSCCAGVLLGFTCIMASFSAVTFTVQLHGGSTLCDIRCSVRSSVGGIGSR